MTAQETQRHIWIQYLGGEQALPRKRAIESLAHAGITASPQGAATPTGPGVVVFDVITPDLCDCIREYSRNGFNKIVAVALTSTALAGGASWRLLRSGASDVVAWEHDVTASEAIAARFSRWEDVDRLVNSSFIRTNLVGRSRAWQGVLRQIVEAAFFTDASVLITGESGTGKELIARLIHTLDSRARKNDLVVLDCTTVVPELSGSEFFGHERGAFTNAVNDRDGAFALANGGTLFLDEVGELPITLQAELLRAVQERTYKRIGGNVWNRTDFRLICATNRDLMQEEAAGRFRRDFYYRIATWTCKLPALRERTDDILPLAEHFMRQLRSGQDPPELDDAVRDYLLKRNYPGNIRDLKQLMARILCRHVGPGPITAGDIPEDDRPCLDTEIEEWRDPTFEQAVRRALMLGVGLKEIGRGATETAITIALDDEEGNLQRAARRLGITDRALQMRRAERRISNGAEEEMVN